MGGGVSVSVCVCVCVRVVACVERDHMYLFKNIFIMHKTGLFTSSD